MSVARTMTIVVTDHAMWRAAERFRRFDTAAIEGEVRRALAAGRVSTERGPLGLEPHSDPASLYVWTANGERVYALKVHRDDPTIWVVTTTLRRGM